MTSVFIIGAISSWICAAGSIALMFLSENPDQAVLKTVACISLLFGIQYMIFWTKELESGKQKNKPEQEAV